MKPIKRLPPLLILILGEGEGGGVKTPSPPTPLPRARRGAIGYEEDGAYSRLM